MTKEDKEKYYDILLPCPFCGEKPDMWAPFPCYPDCYVIECINDNCIRPSTGFPHKDYQPKKNKLIKEWNKRSK